LNWKILCIKMAGIDKGENSKGRKKGDSVSALTEIHDLLGKSFTSFGIIQVDRKGKKKAPAPLGRKCRQARLDQDERSQ